MKFRYAGLALAVSGSIALGAAVGPALSQDISESHLGAARATVDAIGATDEFDGILPQAAMALKAELVQKNPDQAQLISSTVDSTALELASRRSDLEREAANAFARSFTEEELTAISEFYSSEAGKKLIGQGPVVTREVLQAADIWQSGIARDLAREVGAVLQDSIPAAPASAAPTAPATPAAPASD